MIFFVVVSAQAVSEAVADNSIKPVVLNVVARPIVADAILYEDIMTFRGNESAFRVGETKGVLQRVAGFVRVLGVWFKVYRDWETNK